MNISVRVVVLVGNNHICGRQFVAGSTAAHRPVALVIDLDYSLVNWNVIRASALGRL
jgi:hypothetical protein